MSHPSTPPTPSLFGLLRPYRTLVAVLVVSTVASNALALALPALIARDIDAFVSHTFALNTTLIQFFAIAVGVLVFAYIQTVVQALASERVARELRTKLVERISVQEFAYIQEVTPGTLLTNLTSDVDAVKNFIAQAIPSIVSSAFLILGASTLLLVINWKLALVVLLIIPIIGGAFFVVLTKVRKLFKKSQEAIDGLNRIINESILGAALVRVLHSREMEEQKFQIANTEQKNIGMQILRLFSFLIPTISFVANLAIVAIVVLGGHFVITSAMSLGDFSAFMSYVAILIFPILIIGFMSGVIASASASYARIATVLYATVEVAEVGEDVAMEGNIRVQNATLVYGEKKALSDVTLSIPKGSKTAIIGPTAAGKTRLLYALSGLITLTSGEISYDNKPIRAYSKKSFYEQVGIVFQDSIMFNLSLRENIAFNTDVTEEALAQAIRVAELSDFIHTLPEGLETVVSERGSSLSGGQKQRVMLARALALRPKVLLLDDFTARVDTETEERILANIAREYPSLTLISVTQKIGSVVSYDKIVLLMEGEVLASGTHTELLETSPEYVQIAESQKSTNTA